jgi:ABC-type glutathione transport system ATPase component
MQVVFQNPFTSLDPRMRVLDLVAEPLRTHRTVARGGALACSSCSSVWLGEHHSTAIHMSSPAVRRSVLRRRALARALGADLDEPIALDAFRSKRRSSACSRSFEVSMA